MMTFATVELGGTACPFDLLVTKLPNGGGLAREDELVLVLLEKFDGDNESFFLTIFVVIFRTGVFFAAAALLTVTRAGVLCDLAILTGGTLTSTSFPSTPSSTSK